MGKSRFTFVDLFAGIGGFHEAMKKLGGECVAACEIDAYARKTYLHNHDINESKFFHDIKDIEIKDIPKHDILCAGFPCQAFSQRGFKKGFQDKRGILFFNILEIIEATRPAAFFLENVRHLKNHDGGKTFKRIKEELENLGYSFFYFIVHAKDHGLPQLRPRLFMIGFKSKNSFTPPDTTKLELTMSDIMGGNCEREIGFTLRVGGRYSSLSRGFNWDGYIVDGEEKRLSVAQALAMQGFPKDFNFPVSNTQAMKQLGNSVAVPAVRDYANKILETLNL